MSAVVQTNTQPYSPALPRIENPTREEFEEHFLKQVRPVILVNAASHWKALSKWTDDYLRETVGKEVVRVTCCPEGVYDTTHYFEQMEVAKCLDVLEPKENQVVKRYLAGVELRKMFQPLRGDYEIPRFVNPNMPGGKIHFFFGWDTTTSYHFHPCHEAVLVQVQGRKRVRLFPPSDFHSLYPKPFWSQYYNWSGVAVLDPDPRKFPRFTQLQPIECELEAGEALFIPVHWWHAVYGLGKAISITFFWDASVEQWTYPNPGRRVAFRMALSRLAERYPRLSSPFQLLKHLIKR